MKIKVYQYEKCSTCRKALAFLERRGLPFASVPIVESPPTRSELEAMLKAVGGDVRRLFNTSGLLYREMKLGEKLKTLSTDEALELLSRHGKLVKRPFVVLGSSGLVGFNETEWKKAFR